MTTQDITFRTRQRVVPQDHAAGGTLFEGAPFGGSPLRRPGDEGTTPATGGHGSRRTPCGKDL